MHDMGVLYKIRLQLFIFRSIWLKGAPLVSLVYIISLLCGVFSTVGDESFFVIVTIVITSLMALMGGSAFRSSLFVDGQALLAGLIMVFVFFGGALLWIFNIDARIYFFSYSLDAWIWTTASFILAFLRTKRKFNRSSIFNK